jgi:hypothetical protein
MVKHGSTHLFKSQIKLKGAKDYEVTLKILQVHDFEK